MRAMHLFIVLSWFLAISSGNAHAQCGQITIPDPAEYNAYTTAIAQPDGPAKMAAIEQFLAQYPNAPVTVSLDETLIRDYHNAKQTNRAYQTAERLVRIDPGNLLGLFYIVLYENATAKGDPQILADAAAKARMGLNAQRPACMTDSDFQGRRNSFLPAFTRAIASDPGSQVLTSSPAQAVSQPQTEQSAPAPQQPDDGTAQRAALEQQKQDLADKISDLQSDMEEQQSEADNWDQQAESLGDTSNCSGPSASICVAIAQVGVRKAQANANKARQAARQDQAQINRLQGESNDLDQQINSVADAPPRQPSGYDPNAIVNAGNQQAAQIRAIGVCNACAQSADVAQYKQQCSNGVMSACYRAAAALCQCQLNSGGCGSDTKQLQACVDSNAQTANSMKGGYTIVPGTGSQTNSTKPTMQSGQNQKGCTDQKGNIIPGSQNWKACPGW